MRKVYMTIIAAVFIMGPLLPNSLTAQKKPHSAVIGGVKQRFKLAADEPGDAMRFYHESVELLLENNMINDSRDSHKEESWYYLGAVYYYMNEYDKALEAMNKSLEFGKEYLKEGVKISGGIKLFSITETINDIKLKTFNQALRSFENGLASASSDTVDKFFLETIEKCELLLKWDPKVLINGQPRAANVYNFIANSYIKLGEHAKNPEEKKEYRSKIIENLTKLHETDPKNLSIIYNIFVQLYEAQDWQNSIQWIDKALAAPSTDSLSKVIKSQLVERKAYIYDTVLKDPEKAENTYKDLIKADPNNPDWHFNLARLYFGRGANDKAIDELKVVKKLRPDDPEANYQVADEMFFAYQKERAKTIDENGGLKADMKKVTSLLEGSIDACKKNLTEAINVLQKNLDNSNDAVETSYRIGKFYNLLAELEGHVNYALENRDKVKLQKPYFEKAVEYLKKTVQMDDTHKEAWRNLFVAYTNLQMVKERDAAMKKFEALNK